MITLIKKLFLSIFFILISFSNAFSRYYDAQLSRWISVDTALHEYFLNPQGEINTTKGYGGLYNPINLNLYNYTYNNPVKYIDPDGKIGIVSPFIMISSPKVAFRPTLRPVPMTPITKPPTVSFRPGIWSRFTNWIGKKWKVLTSRHGHHSDPKYMGGKVKQPLTRLTPKRHIQLHRDLVKYLKKNYPQLVPKRGNSAKDILQNTSREQRLEAMKRFYEGYGNKYRKAARDFFKQHPQLKKGK